MRTSRDISCALAATLVVALSFGGAWSGEPAARGEPVSFDAIPPGGVVQLCVLRLDKAAQGETLTFFVWLRDGKAGQAWALSPRAPGYCFPVAGQHSGFYGTPQSRFVRQGDELSGVLYVCALSQKQASDAKYVITARVNGAEVTGTYQAPVTGEKGATPAASGALAGRILTEDDLRQQNAPLSAGAAYPCWRNDGSGSGNETGKTLVSDPSLARVVWKSEDLIPGGYYEGSNLGRVCDIQSGHASPVLADGKVFIHYFVGHGEAYDKEKVEDAVKGGPKGRSLPVPEAMWKVKFAKLADQIVTAMDAQTGRTLWRAVMREDGPNISGIGRVGPGGPNSKAPSHLTPCAAYGKVFAKGTGGKLYALDAATGQKVWTAEGLGQMTDNVAFADGVVATGAGSVLTGFDAEKGAKLWTVPGGVRGHGATLRWVCQGKEYFLTATGMCIEPKTGKVRWKAEGVFDGVVAADRQYLLNSAASEISCHAITPDGAKKLWTSPDKRGKREIHPVLVKGFAFMRVMDKDIQDAGAYHSVCMDLTTGQVTGKASGSKSFSSVIAGDGRVFNCNAARVILQNADPRDFRDLKAGASAPSAVVADVSMPIVIQGTPETTAIYADGRLFTRTFDGIICMDLRAEAGGK